MRSLATRIRRNVLLLGFVLCVPLCLASAAHAQFGIQRGPDPTNPRQDGWIAQVFADDARIVEQAYSNGPADPEHDPYPIPGNGTGVYELAGGHPFIGVTDFRVRRDSPDGPPTGGNVALVRVDIPRGLMPNPGQFVRCTDQQLSDIACPRASQIGTQEMVVYIPALSASPPTGLGTGDVTLKVPLYNMTPLSNPNDPGDQVEVPARFGFNPAEAAEVVAPTDPLPNPLSPLLAAIAHLAPVHIVGGVRDAPSANPSFGPPDNGLFFTIDHLPEYDGSASSPGVLRSNLTFWGLPGDDAAHASERGVSCVLFETPPLGLVEPGCTLVGPPESPANPDPDPDTPFLTNPTHCGGVDEITRLSVWSQFDAFDQIDEPTPAIDDMDDPQVVLKHGAQGCLENVPFNDALTDLDVDPQQMAPDFPSGPAVSLLVDQPGLKDKDLFSTSHVKDVSVTLPPGMTLNPSAANGLLACTDAQLAADPGKPGGEACPEASKVGTTSVASPALPNAADPLDLSSGELTGSAYVGQPLAGDRYRLFVTMEGRGISIRLKGSVKPNPITGQLTAVFKDNPQLPFDRLTVDFEDGPRAPLATPLECGPKTASALMTPWSGTAPVTAGSDPFSIAGSGCPAGFAPLFGAKSATPLAGAITPFTATITRPDRNQFLSRARVVAPPGLAGSIKGIPQCASARAATGACPAASKIGTAVTRAGAGSEPFALSGPVYLTEGYKGAPLGMVVVIRAIAGPYDLGTVVVRQAIFVDPEDAHLTVISDPFPTILEGVPIRLRQAEVILNRKGFTYNPTSCGTKQVRATLYPTQGAAVDRVTNLTFSNCQALGFAPKMKMQLVGPRQTGFKKHPRLIATVEQTRGQANIGRVRVALPTALALDYKNSQVVCPVADAAKAQCPDSTQIGTAEAISPALNKPLRGPVYFVQGIRIDPATGRQIRTLPSLLAKLRGEIPINLRGTTAVEGGNLVSTFDRVPDAPVSKFTMDLRGGSKGPLVVGDRRGLCDREQITNAQFTGQNTKAAALNVDMIKPCRRPMIVLRRIKASSGKLVVRGTIRRKATKGLKVRMSCGGTRVVKTAARPRPGRWATSLKRKGACANARKAKLRVSYPGGGDFRIAVRKRNVKLPAGS